MTWNDLEWVKKNKIVKKSKSAMDWQTDWPMDWQTKRSVETRACDSTPRFVGRSVCLSVGHILLFLLILFSNVIFSHSKSF